MLEGVRHKLATWIAPDRPDTAALARAQLRGFDPKRLDNSDDIEVLYDMEDGVDTFLAQVKDIHDNPAFAEIVHVLKRNQIMYSVLETNDIRELNFGRATINGIMLLVEEIERLVGIYHERHSHEGDYDRNAVV